MNSDPRIPVVVYVSPLPGLRRLYGMYPRRILMTAGGFVMNMFFSPSSETCSTAGTSTGPLRVDTLDRQEVR